MRPGSPCSAASRQEGAVPSLTSLRGFPPATKEGQSFTDMGKGERRGPGCLLGLLTVGGKVELESADRFLPSNLREKSRPAGQKLVNSAGPWKASTLKLSIWLYFSS